MSKREVRDRSLAPSSRARGWGPAFCGAWILFATIAVACAVTSTPGDAGADAGVDEPGSGGAGGFGLGAGTGGIVTGTGGVFGGL